MELISDLQGFLDGLPFIAKAGICLLGIALVIFITRIILINPWKEIVKTSKVSWDDELLPPISKRVNAFILVAGGQLSALWLAQSEADYAQLQPYFGATYIMIATSITSVSTKILMPVILEMFQKKQAVTVSGGNPFLVICTRAAVYFVGTYFALNELGIDMLGLFASLTVISLILGIAMKETISNIANSFLLAVDKPFEVGDRIEIEGNMGVVASIGVLSTKLLTRDEKLVIIPNNSIVYSDIVNHARGGGDGLAKRKSLIIDIGVSYDEDVDHVKYVLLSLARDSPHCLGKPEPKVLVNELDEFTKNFRLFSWVENYNEEYIARDWLLRSVDENFKTEGINISYPTEVEIDVKGSEKEDSGKAERQKIARKEMDKEDKRLLKDRENARKRLKELGEEILHANLSGEKVYDLEFEAQVLENELSTFDREG